MRRLSLLLLVAVALPFGAARASDCSISVDVASASAPHVTDNTNDWGGNVGGTGAGDAPAGDVYREGTDLTSAWISRSGDTLTAHLTVANLSEAQPNSIFYVYWTYEGADTTKAVRWVSARLKGYAVGSNYGYVAGSTLPTSSQTLTTVGDASATVAAGTPGRIDIVIPKDGDAADWGAPNPGSTLADIYAESRILAGSPEPLPQNPSGLKYGFVYPADTTIDGDTACDADV
jgi:hypothetical protein